MNGEVKGDRSLSLVSIGLFILLNLIFIPIHFKLILEKASEDYLQLFRFFKFSSWAIQSLAYLVNFKISIVLISNFAGSPRLNGTFNSDSWQKFNMFGVLYILLVYLTFASDFYLYTIQYGIVQKASFVMAEAVIIMTIVSLILILEVLAQFSSKVDPN